jgi:hypothetical protein
MMGLVVAAGGWVECHTFINSESNIGTGAPLLVLCSNQGHQLPAVTACSRRYSRHTSLVTLC